MPKDINAGAASNVFLLYCSSFTANGAKLADHGFASSSWIIISVGGTLATP